MFPPSDIWLASMTRSLRDVVIPAIDHDNSLARLQASMLAEHLEQLARQLDSLSAYEELEFQSALSLAADMLDVSDGGPITVAARARLSTTFDLARQAADVSERRKACHLLGFACETIVEAAGNDGSSSTRAALLRLAIRDGSKVANRELARVDPTQSLSQLVRTWS